MQISDNEKSALFDAAMAEKITDAMRSCGEIMRGAARMEDGSRAITEKEGTANFVTIYDVAVQKA